MKKNIKPKRNKVNEREVTILECLAAGYTDKETAIVLNITHFRISRLICDLLHKTGAVNRPQLVSWAYKKGYLKV